MNGWTNYETWHVAATIGNYENLYRIAKRSSSYSNFVKRMSQFGLQSTPDGVKYSSKKVKRKELTSLIKSFKEV